ncbi:MAG TPA: acetyl-CoA C-acyltransferase [Gemmatimonadales bacterium]|nr:acetyl-CoA C-acyltransferase [Gemmatimonadales bacterium]
MQESRPGRRVAIVAGVRTPFLKSGTSFRDVTAVALARHAARELLFRSEVDGREVDEVIFSQVVPSVLAPNVAREVSLLPQFLPSVPAYTLNRACASSAQAIANAADQIALGHADTILAGGVETLSDIPILHSRRFSRVLVDASRAKSFGSRLAAFGRTRPRDLVPVTPAIAEPSTGESMGQSAEKMAKENGISREAQDDLALRSHQRAAAATADGRLTAEIAPWFGGAGMDQPVTADNGIRADTTPEALAALRPVFDRRYGSVTAGNSSPLTDGAAAVLLMAEEKAVALGYTPLAYLRSYAVAAVDPGWQLLMGPVYAVPKALERAGIAWRDVGRFEIHEAFAAQVLSNAQAWGSQAWAERLGLSGPVGEVDWDRTNLMGGSIAIGHPFAATGARLVTTLANEMRRREVQFGLISICAQGGMGYAMVLERDQ